MIQLLSQLHVTLVHLLGLSLWAVMWIHVLQDLKHGLVYVA